jgi:hypothetical protein
VQFNSYACFPILLILENGHKCFKTLHSITSVFLADWFTVFGTLFILVHSEMMMVHPVQKVAPNQWNRFLYVQDNQKPFYNFRSYQEPPLKPLYLYQLTRLRILCCLVHLHFVGYTKKFRCAPNQDCTLNRVCTEPSLHLGYTKKFRCAPNRACTLNRVCTEHLSVQVESYK